MFDKKELVDRIQNTFHCKNRKNPKGLSVCSGSYLHFPFLRSQKKVSDLCVPVP